MSKTDFIRLKEEFETSEFWKVVGMKITHLAEGEASVRLAYRKELDNVRGTVHGGVYMTLLDTTMGLVCRTKGYDDALTMQMNTHFLKPMVDGVMTSQASIISQTKSTMLVESKIYDDVGDLLGFSTATFRVANK